MFEEKMSETVKILARNEDKTVVFRCSSANIHVVYGNMSICMNVLEFSAYCDNIADALERISDGTWDSSGITVHCRGTSVSMLIEEFIRFAKTISDALGELDIKNEIPELAQDPNNEANSFEQKNQISMN